MILCDLPYGTTACKWDSIIEEEKLFEQYIRIIKDNGSILLMPGFYSGAKMIVNYPGLYRYKIFWNKNYGANFLMSNKQPQFFAEEIYVFYKNQPIYNPQLIKREKPIKGGSRTIPRHVSGGEQKIKTKDADKVYEYKKPTNIVDISAANRKGKVHPTEKPVSLGEYLIKTYTNEGMLVLDNCCGSGSFCLAAKNLNRNFIGMEKEEKYYLIAKERCGC
jgi:DNA modification methylase